MSTTQRYISHELTHFVGSKLRKSKSKSKEDKQYELLIKILGEGRLYNPKIGVSLAVNTSAKISQNEMYLPSMVCFSDIPVEDLTLHRNKYSRFGISFNKDFVASQGGAPIHYIPVEPHVNVLLNITPEQNVEFLKPDEGEHLYRDISKGDYFDDIAKRYHKLFSVLHKLIFEAAISRSILGANAPIDSIWDWPKDGDGYPVFGVPPDVVRKFRLNANNNPGKDAIWYDQQLSQLQRFLEFNIFSFLKFFNHNLSDEDTDNYYFEREWRVICSVQFDIGHVKRVFIPEEYAKKLRNDFPEYYGQVTFAEI